MIDLNFIRNYPGSLDQSLERRGVDILSKAILILDLEYRDLLCKVEYLRYQRNDLVKKIGIGISEKT